MDLTLPRFALPELPPVEDVVRVAAVMGCALALIFAGPLLPF